MSTEPSAEEVRHDPERLAEIVRGRQARIVAVDGCDGVGKTTLANTLAELVGGKAVDVDDHLDRNRGVYVAAVRFEDLRGAIDVASGSGGAVVVSGVCLLDVLARGGVEPDLKIYVEQRSRTGLPSNLDILDCEDGDDSHLRELSFSDLDCEIGRYHRDFQPRRRADVLFIRQES